MACQRTVLLGIRTNLAFLERCLAHPVFLEGGMTTGFLAQQDMSDPYWRREPSAHALAAASLVLAGLAAPGPRSRQPGLSAPAALWLAPSFQATATSLRGLGAAAREVRISAQAGGDFEWTPTPEGNQGPAPMKLANLHADGDRIGFALDGVFRRLGWFQPDADSVWVQDGADAWRYQRVMRFDRAGDAGEDRLRLLAPMSGKAIALPVAVGDVVEPGATLLVMESMKMEMPLCATGAGRVARILVDVGAQLSAGQVLVELEAA
jgi:acetyl/propionyl-CoA carboxylase alpha subunit